MMAQLKLNEINGIKSVIKNGEFLIRRKDLQRVAQEVLMRDIL
jgi:hypothetical protein